MNNNNNFQSTINTFSLIHNKTYSSLVFFVLCYKIFVVHWKICSVFALGFVCVCRSVYLFFKVWFCFNFVLYHQQYWAWYLICCCTRSKSCWTCYVLFFCFVLFYFIFCGIFFYISMFLSKFTRSFKWSSECLNGKCLYMFYTLFFLHLNTHTHKHFPWNPWPNLSLFIYFFVLIMWLCLFVSLTYTTQVNYIVGEDGNMELIELLVQHKSFVQSI